MAASPWTFILIVASLSATPSPQSSRAAELFEQAKSFDRADASATDLEQAARLYEEAARLGHLPAQVRFAHLCLSGRGTPRDTARALRLLEEAAQAGDREGRFLLGMTYLAGSATPKDPALARSWFARAANDGHQLAQFVLGGQLLEGSGGARNEIAAGRWFARASQGPDRQLAARAAKLRDEVIALANSSANETRLASMLPGLVAVWLVAAAVSEPGPSGGGKPPLCFETCMSSNQGLMGHDLARGHCAMVCN